jgi:phosphodiesterase/alkaline phosphatase D-like protein
VASKNRLDLSWKDDANDELGYKIERKIGLAGVFTEIAALDSNATAYSSTGLNAGTLYSYRVRAFNNTGPSAYSNEVSAKTLPNPPKAPAGLAASAESNKRINLAWADSSKTETGFKIERKKGTAGAYAEIATVGANTVNFADTSGLSANTVFFYQVRAYNAGGHSDYSNEASAKTLPNPPKAPVGLTAAAISTSQIDLAWADSIKNENGFMIERKTGKAGTYAKIATVGANTTTYSSLGLKPNTLYFYRVRAYNAGGNSAYSNEASTKTLPNAPAAPGGLKANPATNRQINLSWADSSKTETGFKIERKKGTAGAYAEIATVGADTVNFADTSGLSPNTMYFYQVRAFNAGGNSAYSNEASAKTLPMLPRRRAA